MQRYQDSILLESTSGTPVVGAGLTVLVYNTGTTTQATIWADNGVNLIDQSISPITTTTTGYFEFYAANGRYDLYIYGPGILTILIPDITLLDAAELQGSNYADATGTGDNLVASFPTLPSTVLTDGLRLDVDTAVPGTNTGPVTISLLIRGIAVAPAAIVKYSGINTLVPLVAKDMPAIAHILYNLATNNWILVNPVGGEFLSVTTAPTSTSLTTGTVASVATMNLSIGDWDVTGTVAFAPAATTSVTSLVEGASATLATLGTQGTYNSDYFAAVVPGAVAIYRSTPTIRMKIVTPTWIYLQAEAVFSVSTMTAGGTLSARRAAQ
jgi:hypothetical protein